ncbi:hypothetical protein GS551_18730 [Rhodococcus hoagii]|uniref:Uncharacterized protein n=1 Tax=Rhodococcus hoagii TaxID=43767 RepID=A0AAE2W9C9_RHOHA|nr:hypothetical protein [Prescottella equi]
MTLTADDCLAAEVAIHRAWLDHATTALDQCIRGAVPFSADTVRALIPHHVEAHHPNAIGALFNAARRAGRIAEVGYITPSRSSRHGNRNRLWIGGPNA